MTGWITWFQDNRFTFAAMASLTGLRIFAEKELLENIPDSTATKEFQYAVLSLHCEGDFGAALVRVGGMEPDGSFAYYLYTTADKGKTWQIGEKIWP